MQDSHYQVNRPFFLLTAGYFLWLLAVLLIFGYTPTNDGEGYLEYARHCLQEGQPYPTTTIYNEVPFIWNIGIINLVELSLGIVTLIHQRRFKALFLPLFIVVGGSLAIVLVMHGETRFKDPLMPFMFLLASNVINSKP